MDTKLSKGVIYYFTYCFQRAKFLSICLALLRIATAIVPTIQMFVLANFIDAVQQSFVGKANVHSVGFALTALIAIQFLNYLINTMASFCATKHCLVVGQSYDNELLQKRSMLPFYMLEDADICDLAERVTVDSTDKMHQGFMNLLDIVEYALRIMGICGTIFWANIPVGLVSLMLFSIMVPLAVRSGKEDYEAHSKAVTKFRRARYFQKIISNQENAAERKLYSCTTLFNKKWEENYAEGKMISRSATKKELTHLATGSVLIVFFTCLISVILLFVLDSGAMSIGVYISLITASSNLAQMISWYVALIIEDFVTNRLYISDYFKFVCLPEVELDEICAAPSQEEITKIEFRNVSFTYPNTTHKVLHNISFCMDANKSYALVGENGAGKSTIIKLLLGMYDNYDGEIFVNGKSIRDLTPSERRSLFSCTFQDYAKYEVSIRSNLSPGLEDAFSPDRYEQVLKIVELDDHIKNLSNGIDTLLGRLNETGTDLSGGQWQRIAVARSLIRKAPVLIVDEPTASLDPTAEWRLYQKLLDMDGIFLRILVTHRLGCVQGVDEILVISDGRVTERGSHEELIRQEGMYKTMFTVQGSWYK